MFLSHLNKTRTWALAILIGSGLVFSACNKDLEKAVPIPPPTQANSPTIADLLNDPNYSILKAAVVKAGMLPMLADPSLRFTVFAPDNAAFTASGISGAVINALPAATVAGLVGYHIVPQLLPSANIPTSFPNLQYPTMVNPAPQVSAFLRLTTFPSKRGTTSWVNNVPIIAADIPAVNGVVHKVPVVVAPPSTDLWSRINADPNLTYFKATITRADSGAAAGSRLLDALSTSASASAIAANLTIFAPNDAAMKLFLTGSLTQAFIANGIPQPNAGIAASTLVSLFGAQIIANPVSIPDVPGFPPGIGKMIAAVLTPTLAKGLAVYHILSSQASPYAPPGIRAFSVNLPASPTAIKTLLNSAVSVHPGLLVQATFGATGVTAITVKGAANATAANVLINPFPNGTSDQHYVNGVLHVIDQVLLPQ